jgi:hydroxymethylpyrimidine pyrophosphatase-like HAD family hydrolase
MRYFAIAADYDGTLANSSEVRSEVIGALERLVTPGRRLVLVTGCTLRVR